MSYYLSFFKYLSWYLKLFINLFMPIIFQHSTLFIINFYYYFIFFNLNLYFNFNPYFTTIKFIFIINNLNFSPSKILIQNFNLNNHYLFYYQINFLFTKLFIFNFLSFSFFLIKYYLDFK